MSPTEPALPVLTCGQIHPPATPPATRASRPARSLRAVAVIITATAVIAGASVLIPTRPPVTERANTDVGTTDGHKSNTDHQSSDTTEPPTGATPEPTEPDTDHHEADERETAAPTPEDPNEVDTTVAIADTANPDPGKIGIERAHAALRHAVPTHWLAATPVELTVRGGSTSRTYAPGDRIEISTYHLNEPWQDLMNTMAHEWGHVVAYRQHPAGYPPPGFPDIGQFPEEEWADCVQLALTGIVDPTHGLQPCNTAKLGFTQDFLNRGP